MRSTAYPKLLCAVAMALLLAFSKPLLAQTSERITLSLQNASLQIIFSSIESQTGFRFIYTSEQLKDTRTVSISVNHANLEDVLKICFQDQPISYSLEDKFIIIHKKEMIHSDPDEIKGFVRDENGDPVAGATISVLKTQIATSTVIDGSFSLKPVSEKAVLVFSGASVMPYQLTLHGQRSISITLKNKTNHIDEVQVIAYGTTTKRLNTGDVSMVSSQTIEEQPVENPLAALEGRAPGLVVTQQSGITGGGFFVQIRGQNSIGSGNNPLYIVDGIPYPSIPLGAPESSSGTIVGGNPLVSLNPSDIESISILKDADATSIYGSRGANGVVLITTKKGKAGSTKADAGFYFGLGHITRSMDLLNTPQYLKMRHEAFANDGEIPDAGTAPDLLVWDTTRYTNWEKNLIGGTSQIIDGQASLSGGDVNTQFLFGLGYHQESTVYPGDFGSRRLSGNLNLNHTSPDQKLKLSVLVNYSSFNNNLLGIDLTTAALSTPPDAPPIYDSAGKLNWAGGSFYNPYGQMQQHYNGNTGNLLTHASISYQIDPHFQLKVDGGYNEIQIQEILTSPASSFPPQFGIKTGISVFSNSSVKTWILEPQLQFKTMIHKASLQVLLGSTLEQDLHSEQAIYGFGYTSDALLGDLQAAASSSVSSFNNTDYKYAAIFSRINYNWQDRYLFNVTARRDGSSRFGPGKQFANFGAAGAAWIFTKTAWIQEHAAAISFGKLRGSYGLTGNDQIGDYQYLNTYSPTQYPYLGTPGLVSTRLYNPDYSWETNYKLEFGMMLNFFKDKLGTSVSWYRNRSSNQLVGYPLPLITGQSSVQANLPATVQNTGWEFELNLVAANSRNFQWNISFNMTVPANKLIAFPNLAGSPYANTYVVGQSLYIKKLFHYTGVDPQIGIYNFEDVNHDGQISYPQDLTAYKDIAESYYGGLLNSLNFHRFHLDIFFQFVKQTGANYLTGTFNAPGLMFNQPTLVLNRWQKPGDIKPVQQFSQDYGSAANAAFINSEYYGDNTIGDASFIRLKNLSFSYSLNPTFLQKMHASNASVYIQCQNLLTITHYQGLDPENFNITTLPPLRIISAGFRCSF